MPPQPLSRIRPNVGFALTAEGFDKRPEIAQGIAQCIAYWSWVETQTSRMFVVMSAMNHEEAIKYYIALESAKAKTDALRLLAFNSMEREDYQLINAILRLKKSYQSIRDRIAHWMWGLPTELPNAMVLVDPRVLLSQQARIKEATKNYTLMAVTIDRAIKQEEIFVYRPEDIKHDAENFGKLALLINKATTLCWKAHNNSEHAELRAELAKDARLAQFLSQSPSVDR